MFALFFCCCSSEQRHISKNRDLKRVTLMKSALEQKSNLSLTTFLWIVCVNSKLPQLFYSFSVCLKLKVAQTLTLLQCILKDWRERWILWFERLQWIVYNYRAAVCAGLKKLCMSSDIKWPEGPFVALNSIKWQASSVCDIAHAYSAAAWAVVLKTHERSKVHL